MRSMMRPVLRSRTASGLIMMKVFSISATGSPFDGRAGNAPCALYVRYAMVPKAQGRKPTFRQRAQLKRFPTRTYTARPRNHHHRALRSGALPHGDERRNPLEMRFIRDERRPNQALCSLTAEGDVPPIVERAPTMASISRDETISGPNRGLASWNTARGRSSSRHPRSSHTSTRRPTTSCASRNGMPFLAR